MAFDLDAFVDEIWDIEHILRDRLSVLAHEFDSAGQQTPEHISREVSEILRWLPSAGKGTADRKRGRPRTMHEYAIRALTMHLKTPKSWRRIALEVKGCTHVCPHCRRKKGKPEECGFKLQGGCPTCGMKKRTKPEIEQSCYACGDAIRDAVGSLVKFLHSKGLYPTHRKEDLAKLSPAELHRWFDLPHD